MYVCLSVCLCLSVPLCLCLCVWVYGLLHLFLGVCDLPRVTGVCRAYFRRWYYNKPSGKCLEFIYGGCGSNGNNFLSKGACESFCKRG